MAVGDKINDNNKIIELNKELILNCSEIVNSNHNLSKCFKDKFTKNELNAKKINTNIDKKNEISDVRESKITLKNQSPKNGLDKDLENDINGKKEKDKKDDDNDIKNEYTNDNKNKDLKDIEGGKDGNKYDDKSEEDEQNKDETNKDEIKDNHPNPTHSNPDAQNPPTNHSTHHNHSPTQPNQPNPSNQPTNQPTQSSNGKLFYLNEDFLPDDFRSRIEFIYILFVNIYFILFFKGINDVLSFGGCLRTLSRMMSSCGRSIPIFVPVAFVY